MGSSTDYERHAAAIEQRLSALSPEQLLDELEGLIHDAGSARRPAVEPFAVRLCRRFRQGICRPPYRICDQAFVPGESLSVVAQEVHHRDEVFLEHALPARVGCQLIRRSNGRLMPQL